MAKDLVFDLSPTQSAFVETDAHIAMLMGPMGEGKTFSAGAGLVRHALRCGKDIRGAIIRDTHQNIRISTVPSLKEIFGDWVDFHDDNKVMVIHSQPKITCDLFGIDDPASLSKLQGPEYAIIWLEEPAPIVEKANAGLPRDVFDLAIARASRQKGTKLRVQVSQNPADEDHWTEEVAQMPEVYAEDLVSGQQIVKKVFRIPYGENKYLNDLARLANKAAFQHDAGKFARYVTGIAAPVRKGSAVTPEYNAAIHFSQNELPVVPNCPGFRFYDGFHHPVCLIGQILPGPRLVFHNAFWGDGIGIKELVQHQVISCLMSPKFKGKIADWRDIGDPTMRTPDQSTTGVSAAKVVEGLLKTRFEPGPTKWNFRIAPLRTALSTLGANGQPLIQISKSAYELHRALNGGWHFKTDNSKNIIGNLPVKDKNGDLGDAACYGVALTLPYARVSSQSAYSRQVNPFRPQARAMSYAERAAAAVASPADPERGIFLNQGFN